MSECRSCGAEVFWAKTDRSVMLVDREPRADGNLVVTGDLVTTVRVLRKGEEYDGDRYVSHFATCPNSAAHRKVSKR